MERFWLIPNLVVSTLLKCDVNCRSLSLMIFFGMLNHRMMLSKYSWAIPAPVIIVLHRRITAA